MGVINFFNGDRAADSLYSWKLPKENWLSHFGNALFGFNRKKNLVGFTSMIDILVISFKLLKIDQGFVDYEFLNTVCRDALSNTRI